MEKDYETIKNQYMEALHKNEKFLIDVNNFLNEMIARLSCENITKEQIEFVATQLYHESRIIEDKAIQNNLIAAGIEIFGYSLEEEEIKEVRKRILEIFENLSLKNKLIQ